MKLTKKVFFKIHSWIGIKLSILFFIVCFSGTLATLSHEMDWLFITAIRASPKENTVARNVIVSNLKKAYPDGKITYWLKPEEPYLCDIIYLIKNQQRTYVFANPYTGEIQGSAQMTFHRFFRDLHYFLFIPFQIGHFTVLLFGFLLLISLITALYFYKKWWKKLFELQTGKGPLVLFRSLHRLVGLWSVPFSLVFSITGIWYFIERANIAGIGREVNPASPIITTIPVKPPKETSNLSYTLNYDRIISLSQEAIPGLKAASLNTPNSPDRPVYVRGKSTVPLVRKRANRVFIHPLTYEVLHVQNAEDTSTLMWINDIADPIHFGYWGGLITKIIWFVMGLGISSLVLTGIWISLRRNAIKKKKKQQKVLGAWRYINWGIYGLMTYYMYLRLISYGIATGYIVFIYTGWLLLTGLAYYIFVYRLHKSAALQARTK